MNRQNHRHKAAFIPIRQRHDASNIATSNLGRYAPSVGHASEMLLEGVLPKSDFDIAKVGFPAFSFTE